MINEEIKTLLCYMSPMRKQQVLGGKAGFWSTMASFRELASILRLKFQERSTLKQK